MAVMRVPSAEPTLHLDANILILGSRAGHPARDLLRTWSETARPVAVSAMAWAEFRCGPATDASIAAWEFAIRDAVIPVDRAIADEASALFNITGRRTRSLPDCIIAATAILYGASLATLNRRDFEPFVAHGLTLD